MVGRRGHRASRRHDGTRTRDDQGEPRAALFLRPEYTRLEASADARQHQVPSALTSPSPTASGAARRQRRGRQGPACVRRFVHARRQARRHRLADRGVPLHAEAGSRADADVAQTAGISRRLMIGHVHARIMCSRSRGPAHRVDPLRRARAGHSARDHRGRREVRGRCHAELRPVCAIDLFARPDVEPADRVSPRRARTCHGREVRGGGRTVRLYRRRIEHVAQRSMVGLGGGRAGDVGRSGPALLD